MNLFKFRLGECEQFGFQHFLGDIGTDDLVFHFAVFEEQEEGNGFDIVLDGKIASVIDVDLGDFGLSLDFTGELLKDWTDHFAGAAPFGPEIDKDREIGIDHFGLEIRFV